MTDQTARGLTGAAHCARCDHIWTRTLASLQTHLPAEHFDTVCRTLAEVSGADRDVGDVAGAHSMEGQFELVLCHDCAAVACTDPNCGLCCNSTSRRCSDLLLQKYLVRDPLVPACGARTMVRIKRHGTNGTSDVPLAESDLKKLPEFILQVCALPLGYYLKHKLAIPWASIQECNTLTAQEEGFRHREAVLHCKDDTGALEEDGFISFPHALDACRGITATQIASKQGWPLPEVFFAKRSGESLLDGKQPQIVLAVRAVTLAGVPLAEVQAAVSNPFCVATRRVKGAMKVDIPSMDQEVRVLIHIGDACIRKLHELHLHVNKSKNSVVVVPEGCEEVRTVQQMAELIAANRSSHMGEKRLYQGILNMNEEKWKDLQKQISKAVKPDSSLRVFYCGTFPQPPLPNVLEGAVDVGLVFKCDRGTVDLQESGISGVVMRSSTGGLEAKVRRELLTQEPQLLASLFMHARIAWLLPGHPGWGVFKFQGSPCSVLPRALDSIASDQSTPFTYPCDHPLIPPYTPPPPSADDLHMHVDLAHDHLPSQGLGVASGVQHAGAAEGMISSIEMDARAVADAATVSSLAATGKQPENFLSLFHLSTDPLVPVGGGDSPGYASKQPIAHTASDNDMHAQHAFTRAEDRAARIGIGASVFDSVSLKELPGVSNLSSLFASAVSLPADETRAQAQVEAAPPVVNWMATMSNAVKMGINPVNVFPQAMHAGDASRSNHQDITIGAHLGENTAFVTTPCPEGAEGGAAQPCTEGANLRRPRSNALGSSLLDVARSDRQRLRPDTEEQMHTCNAGDENEARPAGVTGNSDVDMHGGLSFLNNAMPPSSFSKLFSAGLSVDLNQPDLALNSALFNSRPVNGSVMLPGVFSSELQVGPSSMRLPDLSTSLQPGLQAAAAGSGMHQYGNSAIAKDENQKMEVVGSGDRSGGGGSR